MYLSPQEFEYAGDVVVSAFAMIILLLDAQGRITFF